MTNSGEDSTRLISLDWAYIKSKLGKLERPGFWTIVSLFGLLSYLSLIPVKNLTCKYLLLQLPSDSNIIFSVLSMILAGVVVWLMIDLGQRRYFIRKFFVIGYLYLLITWWFYFRYVEEWIPLHTFGINLLDILYCLPVAYFFGYFRRAVFTRFDSRNDQPRFLEDLEKETLDPLLDEVRYGYACEIAASIESQTFQRAFAVAIEGPWGSGKTSFVNTIAKKFDKERTLIVQFNPINYENEEYLIKGFLKELEKVLNDFDDSVGGEIDQYISLLTSVSPSAGQSIRYLLNRSGSATDSHGRINDAIQRIGKKIVVFIDDLDRLNKDEIMAVLKLIRNTANFSNCCYIVPFDKEYIQKELSVFELGSEFYEKYFQFEFYLPKFYDRVIQQNFIGEVDILLNGCNYDSNELEEAICNPLFYQNIKTVRDSIRLANLFAFDFRLVEPPVDLYDFLLVEILKLKYGDVYTKISLDIQKYASLEEEINFYHKDESQGFENTVLLQERVGNSDNVIKLLTALFEQSHPSTFSVKKAKYFVKYFNLEKLSGQPPYNEFIEAFNAISNDRTLFLKYIKKFPEGALEYLESEYSKTDHFKHLVLGLLTFSEKDIKDAYCTKALEQLNWLVLNPKNDNLGAEIELSISEFRSERILSFYLGIAKEEIGLLKEGPLEKSLKIYLDNLDFERLENPIHSFHLYMEIVHHIDSHDVLRSLRMVAERKENGYRHLLASLIRREPEGLYRLDYIDGSQPMIYYYHLLLTKRLLSHLENDRKNIYDCEFLEFLDLKNFVDQVASSFAHIPFHFQYLFKPEKNTCTLIIFKFKEVSVFQNRGEFVDDFFSDFYHFISYDHGYFSLLSKEGEKLPSEVFKDARLKLIDMLGERFGMAVSIKEEIHIAIATRKNPVDIFNETSDIQLAQIEPNYH